MVNRTILVIGVVVGAVGLGGCQTLEGVLGKRPTARLQGVKFGEINLQAAQLIFDVEVENPYAVALPLTKLKYGVTTGESQLAAGETDTATQIPAGAKQSVSLPVRVSYLDLVKAVKGFRPGATIPYKADLTLGLDAPVLGSIGVPVSRQGELTVPNIPKADEIQWQKILEAIPRR